MNWQTLAPELIFQILSKFLPGLTLDVTGPSYFPWYLGHICSSWRAMFKSSPQFWSSLVVDIWPNADLERAMLLIEMAIQQSKNHPLTFQYKDNLSHCHELLEALMAQSTRWLNAYLYLSPSTANLLYAVKTRLPILRAFRLMITGKEDSLQFSDLFEDAPQVRHACIVDYPAWKLNWSSITTLHLRSENRVQSGLLVKFLQGIEHLEELYLKGDGCDTFAPRVALPFLRCLGTSAVENLLLFETPALEELYIEAFSNGTATQYSWLVRDWVVPLNHLKKLVLLLTRIDMAVLIFQCLPANVPNIDFYIQDFSLLKILPLYPSARHLETMTVGVLDYESREVIDVLDVFYLWSAQGNATTGFGPFQGLKRFTLIIYDLERAEVLDRIESRITNLFEERGVRCSIKHPLYYSDFAVPPFDLFGGQVTVYCNY